MNWQLFDRIIVMIDPKYQQLKNIQQRLKSKFGILNFDNVEFHYKPDNKISHNIYQTLRSNKFLIDWYNTLNDGDFLGKDDFCHTMYMIDIIKKCYLLNYKYIYVFDVGCFDNCISNNVKFKLYMNNFPHNFDGYVLMKYKEKCNKHGRNINSYYFDCEWSHNIKKINMYAISRNGMKNILDNQSMIIKKFDYYLTHRNMPYDSLVQHIALDLD